MKKSFFLSVLLIFSILFVSGCSSGGESGGGDNGSNITDGDNTTDDNNDNGSDVNNSMKFIVHVPAETPEDEIICIGFDSGDAPRPMHKVTPSTWELTFDITTPIPYRYCRNCECGAADEQFDTTEKGWRDLSVVAGGTQEDTVTKWRWWNSTYFTKANEVNLSSEGYTLTKPGNLPRSDFMTGVMFNDYWDAEWIYDLNSTMAHLKQESNATWIEYAPVNNIEQFYPTPVISFDGPNGTSEEELIAIIDAAHAHGLKVFINPIPWALSVTDPSPNDHNASWWQGFHDAYKPILIRYAQIAETHNVEMLAFKMWPSIDDLNESERQYMDDLALSLLQEVDGNYSGEIAVQALSYDEDKPDLKVYSAQEADYLALNIWSYYPWPLSMDPNNSNDPGDADANVTTLKNYFSIHLDSGSYGSIESFSTNHDNKPIVFEQISAPSYDGAIVAPAGDDELLNPFFVNDDSTYLIDLQEQADVMETILSEASQRDFIKGSFAFTYFYWNSIDKDINVRGKPAEKVLKKWYGWMQ